MKSIPYATQSIDQSDIRAVTKVLKSSHLTQGPETVKFEQAIADYCGAKFAVAVNSGTSALHIACLAAGLEKGDELITSPITFVASANCALYCGAKPVFADIKEETVNIDPAQIEKKITTQTKIVIPVDFAGYPTELSIIKRLAQKNRIVLIDDASHALGALYKGKRLGSGDFADMTILSFHPVKHIATAEGGMVLTNNKDFYEKLIRLRTHGITRDPKLLTRPAGGWYYEMLDLGFNYRLTDVQCALGLSQLRKLPQFLNRRREITARYNAAFSKYDELRLLKEIPETQSAHHLYVVQFKRDRFAVSRREIFDEYRRQGIGVNAHYIPVYLQPYYQKLGYKQGLCLRAEKYYEETITLPLFPKMTEGDRRRVINVTEKIIKQFGK